MHCVNLAKTEFVDFLRILSKTELGKSGIWRKRNLDNFFRQILFLPSFVFDKFLHS